LRRVYGVLGRTRIDRDIVLRFCLNVARGNLYDLLELLLQLPPAWVKLKCDRYICAKSWH
jgi:hypothetical protein